MVLHGVRTLIGLGVLTAGVLALVAAWLTGVLRQMVDLVTGLWSDLMSWVNQPLSWEHLVAGLGFLIIPTLFLIVLAALTDP